MPLSKIFPRLELVPTERIRFHEAPERRRTLRLVERLRTDALLKNPPILAATGRGDFLLLDGANRVSAFRELEYPEIPAQVVAYSDPEIELRGWHHLLLEPSRLDLERAYGALPGVSMRTVERAELASLLEFREVYAVWVDRHAVARALFPAGPETPSMRERMRVLTEVIGCYEGESPLERIKLPDYDSLPEVLRSRPYELCLFPVLTKEELLGLVRASEMIPTGITRHLIPGRVLGLNIELAFLRELGDRAEREKHFHAHIEQLEVRGRIRFYEESVFVMNE